MRLINKFLAVLSFIPYVYLITYISYILRIIIAIGRIPSKDNPSPNGMGFNTHYHLVFTTFDISLFGILLFALFAGILTYLKKFNLRRSYKIIFLIGSILFFLQILADPLNLWFDD